MHALTESKRDPNDACFTQRIDAGDYFIHIVRAGQTLRIVDVAGNQAADTLFYNAADAVLNVLDPGPVHLVCHSTGCGTGLSVAAGHPERIAALVLANPWSHADPHLHAMQTLRKAAARALDPEHYAHFNAALLFPPDYRRRHVEGFARLAAEAPANPQDADEIARRLDAILAFDARSIWAGVRCATLVLAAKDDQLMPPWFAEEAAAGIKGAELVVFDAGGHMLPESRCEAFTATVLAFLERASRPGQAPLG